MIVTRRSLVIMAAFVLMLVVSACGGDTSSTNTAAASNTPTSAPTTAPTATTASSSFAVQTAQATVNGKAVTILTDPQGKTLYYFTPDTASKTVCTSGCAQTWPPLLFTGTGNPSAATTLAGVLAVYKNGNGNQIIYNDHPLYTYVGDTAANQTNGEGIGGKWFVATTDLAKNKA